MSWLLLRLVISMYGLNMKGEKTAILPYIKNEMKVQRKWLKLYVIPWTTPVSRKNFTYQNEHTGTKKVKRAIVERTILRFEFAVGKSQNKFKSYIPRSSSLLHLWFPIHLHSTRITTVIRLCDVSMVDIFLVSNACRSVFLASSSLCGTGGHFPGTRQRHKRDHLLHLLLRFRMHGPKPPPPHTSLWRGA